MSARVSSLVTGIGAGRKSPGELLEALLSKEIFDLATTSENPLQPSERWQLAREFHKRLAKEFGCWALVDALLKKAEERRDGYKLAEQLAEPIGKELVMTAVREFTNEAIHGALPSVILPRLCGLYALGWDLLDETAWGELERALDDMIMSYGRGLELTRDEERALLADQDERFRLWLALGVMAREKSASKALEALRRQEAIMKRQPGDDAWIGEATLEVLKTAAGVLLDVLPLGASLEAEEKLAGLLSQIKTKWPSDTKQTFAQWLEEVMPDHRRGAPA